MNKKGKNKKANKNSVQNVEVPAPVDSVLVQDVELPAEMDPILKQDVTEADVPIDAAPKTSEVTHPEIQDAPRKPKRNKGKKKKGKDDFIENTEKEEVQKKETTVAVEEQPVEITTAKSTSLIESQLPTARKKKNKSKNTELGERPPSSQNDVVADDNPLVTTESIPNADNQDHDIKSPKKKNKKKKRNDSERSDKDEALACTAAFHKILDVASEFDGSTKNKCSETLLDEPSNKEIASVLNPTTSIENKSQPSEGSIKPETKGKKKNKKDRRQAKMEDELSQLDSNTDEQIDRASQLVEEKNNDSKIDIILEDSPKSKAIIAKPVEKKRKEKHSDSTEEYTPQNIKTVTTEQTESKQSGEHAIIEVIDILDIPFTSTPKEEGKPKIDDLSIPDNAMGKKRKKSPKLPKQIDVLDEIEPLQPETKIHSVKENVSSIEIDSKSAEKLGLDKSQIPYVVVPQPKESTPQPKESTPQPKESTPQPKESTPQPSTKESIIDIKNVTETTGDPAKEILKLGKKRRKSPKLPKPEGKTEVIKEPETKQSEEKNSVQALKLDEIEIRSLKTDESEGSTCDVSPEIFHPRSTSQQLLDDNNNMVIREMLPSEPGILLEPLAFGTVETPKTPDRTTTTTDKYFDTKSKSKDHIKTEKTDLKSKMMEVNQDMEDLRISIEKSLAELTSIEKNEEIVEKQFENKTMTANTMPAVNFQPECILQTETQKRLPEGTLNTTESVKLDEVSLCCETKSVDSKSKEVELTQDKKDITPIEKILEDSLKVDKQNNTSQGKIKLVDKESIRQPSDMKMEIGFTEDNKNSPPIDMIVEVTSYTDKLETKHTGIEAVDHPTKVSDIFSEQKLTDLEQKQQKNIESQEPLTPVDMPPMCPARKDHKGKHKKKRGNKDTHTIAQVSATTETQSNTTTTESKDTKNINENKSESTETGKQKDDEDVPSEIDYEPIEHFEDALTSSVDDVNKTFEMIVEEDHELTNPQINITAPDEEKATKVTPPKNLLGHPDIPVQSNKDDYKKEKNKIPNESQAKVKIKDSVEVEKNSKNTQTVNKIIVNSKNDNEEYVYKYSFRKVFLQCVCHVCKKELKQRVACGYCNLVSYCSAKHKDEDWPQHQAMCFAVSTIVHLKDQKFIYSDMKNITGHDYRLFRMQMIVSCEKILKRRLVPWEQEALLYPRICALASCREWRHSKLQDCEGCGQISYCSDKPDHLPKVHQRWCKSYSLYQKLVCYQQTQGRLEPKLPSKIMQNQYQIPEKINEVLASMYEEKIDMSDIQYAALTQLATAPLTAAYCHQIYRNRGNPASNGLSKKSSFTIHVVGAELQFEADALNKWEVFFLHLRPDLRELRVVLVNYNLNPSNLPLDLLGKVKVCENCRQNKRRVVLNFQDKRTYPEYRASDDFVYPDLVCAFNPSIHRSSIYNGNDPWPTTIHSILKLKVPLLLTGYTLTELNRDTARIKECELPCNVISEPKINTFASVRPDRNFITDDEMPLLFKNYCYTILCG